VSVSLALVVAHAVPTRYPPQVALMCLLLGVAIGLLWGFTILVRKVAPVELLLLGGIVGYVFAYRMGILWETGVDYLSDLLPLIIHAGALVAAVYLGRLAARDIYTRYRQAKGLDRSE